MTLDIDGGVLGTFRVRAGDSSEVTALVLRAAPSDRNVLVVATALLDGGAQLWQPPVVWTFDPRFSPVDYEASLHLGWNRTDVLLLTWTDADAGVYATDLAAQVGAAQQHLLVTVTVPELPPAQTTPPPATPSSRCGCGGADPAMVAPGSWRRSGWRAERAAVSQGPDPGLRNPQVDCWGPASYMSQAMATSNRLPQPDAAPHTGKPDWLKVRLPHGEGYERVKAVLREVAQAGHGLRGGALPQHGRVLGRRHRHGDADGRGLHPRLPLLPREGRARRRRSTPRSRSTWPARWRELELKYIVVTSVNRDELPDGGAGALRRGHLAPSTRESPKTTVEVLIPDFQGVEAPWPPWRRPARTWSAHNIETVERLHAHACATAARTTGSRLEVLEYLKRRPERSTPRARSWWAWARRDDELDADLRATCAAWASTCSRWGSTCSPRSTTCEVERFASPEEFDGYQALAEAMGFLYVAAGPLVRSSYRAAEFFMKGLMERDRTAQG